ncbi:T-cell surface antigen CD2 [Phodopus roborovskii]|uniref:T-cell surface antigen CD2 n=1 Tax=Phodopus roborovskii TaxID=109678 RepID=A0AAU9ZY49_PHORO|nr:T-cell surface antigen CD2 [Phodopus roborovskii]CAH6929335.1 Cd2 [Phodopus roborovskii]
MRCEFLASFLLLFSISSKGAVSGDSSIIWGALGHDINLTIPNFQVTDTDEVRWEKGRTLVAKFKKEMEPFLLSEAFEILTNETLQIKKLKRDDNGTYNVIVYGANGSSKLQKTFHLRILERVSKPEIYWECSNTTLTCEVEKGTDLELKLYRGKKHLVSLHQKIISHTWTNLNAPFKCNAKNKVSEESVTAMVSCSEKDLNFYVIVGSCAGGVLLVVLGALLIFCVCKRKKNRRRKDEELEIKTPRMSSVERGPKPHPAQAAASQNPVASQAPPPPGHHLQTPGPRPLPPSHRTRDHQQKKRPPPSSTQAHQQKGPPLPRPRVQPKPPCRSGEDAPLPPPN